MNRTSQVSAAWGAGGMVSTAPEVARWACALFEGKVLSADSLDQMLGFRELFIPLSPIVGCGLGALRALLLGREYWGHGGNMIGYSTIKLYAPKERVSIALLFNQDFIDYAVGAKRLDSIIAAILP